MQHNPASTTPAASATATSARVPRMTGTSPKSDRCSNEHIKELLRTYGLRTSLIRLKVIDALHSAAVAGHPIGVRGVHSHLEGLDIALSFLSVREVLKRLCVEKVIALNPDKTYSLEPPARAMLDR